MLAGYFLQALLFPKDHIDFIYSMGFVIFLLEFLNIHSTGMIMGASEQKKTLHNLRHKGFLLILYLIFYLVAFSVAKNYYVVISAVISFLSKLFFKQALPKDTSNIAVSGGLLVILTVALAMISDLIKIIIPFPEEVYLNKPGNTSGVFVDVPQTLLLWGVLYYFLLGLYEIVLFKKTRNP